MQVTETLADGLKRELTITIPATDLSAKLDDKLSSLKSQVRLPGFRPGKVPVSHLKKVYGKQAMAEVINDTLNESTNAAIAERKEKPASEPKFTLPEDEKKAEDIIAGKEDLEIAVAYEIIPDFEVKDFSGIQIERPVVDVTDDMLDERMKQIASSNVTYKAVKRKAKNDDQVTFDFLGKVDGEAFDGGAAEGFKLVLGSGQFIPGFEEQMVGLKAGDEKTLEVTFPEDYQAENLAGKAATFDVTVHEVGAPEDPVIDEAFATNLGLESLDKLKEAVKSQLENEYGQKTRMKVKRQLLDALDEAYNFDLPPSLVDQEFEGVWKQVTDDLERAGRTFEEEDTTEDKAKEEYRVLAERRVRLGLLLAEVGGQNDVQVTNEELQRAVVARAQQFPGQEREVIEFFQKNPQQLAGVRAPIFEDKVIDFILELANVTDKSVDPKDLDDEDEHDHDHHGHDHDHDH
ncbi:MAG: trigger factor [Rhizobiales bacterium]|nr:trigger factor [Hyphomicrobiales bacterium]MBO6698219.1 trigger factor [Hyphomicrobiales bacterium]MBO6735527.1 trigger factor [Hyphomicrobiales bacterium]MBO6910665.1 trigger factor [Hyphomicrobiales bacterium]MBO6956054.1 trigger factor [Hyphomicrobiales bacterium]